MEIVEYNGKTYERTKSGKWADQNGMLVPNLQSKLDKLYSQNIDTDSMDVSEMLLHADKMKNAGTYGPAIKIYEELYYKIDSKQRFGLLSKMSSCYRLCGMPRKSIELYEKAKKEFGSGALSSSFMTSVAAAYLDVGETAYDLSCFEKAKKCADTAFAKNKGKADGELKGVYGRLKKITTGSGKYDGPED